MPLYIRDDRVEIAVEQLAAKLKTSKTEAVRRAVDQALALEEPAIPLRERLAVWRTAHPLPAPTGRIADKQFFDDLSGGL